MKILIPDLGDIDDVEVTEFFVAEGTAVCADEPVAIVESDKAAMEIVAGADGVVTKFLVSIGDRLREGDALAELELAAVDQHGLELKDSAQKGSAAQQSQVAEGGRETEAAESAVATASELLPDSQIRPASIAPKSSVGLANTPALDVGLGSSDSAVYAGPATRRARETRNTAKHWPDTRSQWRASKLNSRSDADGVPDPSPSARESSSMPRTLAPPATCGCHPRRKATCSGEYAVLKSALGPSWPTMRI